MFFGGFWQQCSCSFNNFFFFFSYFNTHNFLFLFLLLLVRNIAVLGVLAFIVCWSLTRFCPPPLPPPLLVEKPHPLHTHGGSLSSSVQGFYSYSLSHFCSWPRPFSRHRGGIPEPGLGRTWTFVCAVCTAAPRERERESVYVCMCVCVYVQ